MLRFGAIAAAFITAEKASAHVGYILSDAEMAKQSGTEWEFLLSALQNPVNLSIMGGTLLASLVVYVVAIRASWVRRKMADIARHAASYEELAPWMLRLGLGIALIGAGLAGNVVSPLLESTAFVGKLQILLGFLLLAGFLLAPALWIVLGLYITAVFSELYILGNAEFAAAALALILLGNRRPGLDEMLDVPFFAALTGFRRYVPLLLRIGLGGAMVYLAIYEKFLNPKASALVLLKTRLQDVVPVDASLWVLGAGLVELAIGLAIVAGFKTRLFSAIAFITLSLSFFYFGEEVYSHIALFAVLSAIFTFGSTAPSIDEWLKQRKRS